MEPPNPRASSEPRKAHPRASARGRRLSTHTYRLRIVKEQPCNMRPRSAFFKRPPPLPCDYRVGGRAAEDKHYRTFAYGTQAECARTAFEFEAVRALYRVHSATTLVALLLEPRSVAEWREMTVFRAPFNRHGRPRGGMRGTRQHSRHRELMEWNVATVIRPHRRSAQTTRVIRTSDAKFRAAEGASGSGRPS